MPNLLPLPKDPILAITEDRLRRAGSLIRPQHSAISESKQSAITGQGSRSTSGTTIGGTGITSLEGQTGATQTFGDDTNVVISSAANVHQLGWSGQLSIGRGGTGQATAQAAFDALSPLSAKGSLITRDGSNNVPLTVGADGQVLSADSGAGSGLTWKKVTLGGGVMVSGTLPIDNGGTGQITAAAAAAALTGWNIVSISGANVTTTSTTLVDITGMSYACAANTLYEFEVFLIAGTSAVTTGTKYGVQYSAAGASVGCIVDGTSSNTAALACSLQALNSGSSSTFLITSSVKGFIRIRGWLQTGANAGNLTIQHLKVTSGTSTIYIGSMLKVRAL